MKEDASLSDRATGRHATYFSRKLEDWAKLGCREDFCVWKTIWFGGLGLWGGSLGLCLNCTPMKPARLSKSSIPGKFWPTSGRDSYSMWPWGPVWTPNRMVPAGRCGQHPVHSTHQNILVTAVFTATDGRLADALLTKCSFELQTSHLRLFNGTYTWLKGIL
jgi:hypothetical protein